MDLQENERMEEWFLVVGDWFRETNKIWFYALAAVFIAAIPLYMVVKLSFEGVLVNSITPIRINYTEVTKQPLTVSETKIFNLGNGTYSGYAKIRNPNSEWGVPEQSYHFEFKNGSGQVVAGSDRATFVLPQSEKLVVFPRFSAPTEPIELKVTLAESTFIRPPQLPTLNLEIQRRSLDLQVDQTVVNAVIVNRTPFKITRVDLPVLLFNSQNQIIGVNYTNINDLSSNESRSFQYNWYNRINDVARIEINPELNPYNRDLFGAVPGQNPFDDLE